MLKVFYSEIPGNYLNYSCFSSPWQTGAFVSTIHCCTLLRFFTPKINDMQDYLPVALSKTHLEQMAWVVNDIISAERFFINTLGVKQFIKLENVRADETQGMYLNGQGDFTFHLYLAYLGNIMVELIQPISGKSIYRDFLDKRPEGGVHHMAFTLPEADLDIAISELIGKGYPIVQSLILPVARVAYFDTSKEIGIYTELIGITEAGVDFLRELKGESIEAL